MDNAHEMDSDGVARQGQHLPPAAPAGDPARAVTRARLRPSRSARGFSVVELAVSLGIFILIAAMVTIAVSRSLSATSAVRTDRVVEQALTAQLTTLTAVPYASLLSDNFTVPSPCTGTAEGSGIGGDSCVNTAAGKLRISYRYQSAPGGRPDATPVCSNDAGPESLNDSVGAVGVCAQIDTVNGVAAEDTRISTTEVSARVNAPAPGFRLGQGLVKATLRAPNADAELASGVSLFLVKAADPTIVVSSAVTENSTAYLNVPSTTENSSCIASSPCMLALAATSTPNTDGTLVLYGGGVSAGPGEQTTVESADPTTLRTRTAGASIVAGPNEVVSASAAVATAGTARLDLYAADGATKKRNPYVGSVCLWATFPDGPTHRTVPVCNSVTSGFVDLATYAPYWAENPASPVRYAFPVGVPIHLSVDHPDGTCFYAPGMKGATLAGDTLTWSPRATCTSYTWGTPDSGLDAPITLRPGQGQLREVVWNSHDTNGAAGAVPAAGYTGQSQLWTKPRTAPGCATDATCAPVPQTTLEDKTCPGEYCYSGGNVAPDILTPAGAAFTDASTATTFVRQVVIDDVDGDSFSVALGSPGATSGWDLQWKVAASPTEGTWQTWSAGTDLRQNGAGPLNLYLSYTRPQDTSAVAPVFRVKDNSTHGDWVNRPLTLWYTGTSRNIDVSSTTLAQAATTKVPFQVNMLDTGAPVAGATLSVTGAPSGMTATSSTTTSTGVGALSINAGTNTPAGTYTLTAAAPNAQSATFQVTVTQSAGTVSMVATGGPQGGTGSATATVLDKTAVPMPGVVVSFATTAAGAATSLVVPATSGCTTSAAGTCTVPLTIKNTAPAGTYQVTARSGNALTPAATVAVTSVAKSVAPESGTTQSLIRGTTTTYKLLVTDRAGGPVAGQNVTHPGNQPPGVTVSTPTGVTTAQGSYLIQVATAAGAPTGAATMSITVGGVDLTYPVTIADETYAVAAGPISLNQTETVPFNLIVTSAGNRVPNKAAVLSTDDAALKVTENATTNSSGVLSGELTAGPGLRAGARSLLVTIDSQTYTVPVSVTAKPSAVTMVGDITQIGTGQPAQIYVTDAAGDPVRNLEITLTVPVDGVSVAPATALTGADGSAAFTLDIPTGIPAGNHTAIVTSGTVLAESVVFTVSQYAQTLKVSPAPISNRASTATQANISAVDPLGVPVAAARFVPTWDRVLTTVTTRQVRDTAVLFDEPFDTDTGWRARTDLTGTGAGMSLTAPAGAQRNAWTYQDTTSPFTGVQVEARTPMAYDPAKTYRVSARVHTDAPAATGQFSVGILGFNDSGTIVNRTGGTSATNFTPVAAASTSLSANDGWVTVTGYFSATATAGQAAATPNYLSPGPLAQGTTKFVPVVSLNTGTASGAKWDVDHVLVTEVAAETTTGGAVTTDALGSAALLVETGATLDPASTRLTLTRTGVSHPSVHHVGFNNLSEVTNRAVEKFSTAGGPYWFYGLDNTFEDSTKGPGTTSAWDTLFNDPATFAAGVSVGVEPGMNPASRAARLQPGQTLSFPVPASNCTANPGTCNQLGLSLWFDTRNGSGLDIRKGLADATATGFHLWANATNPTKLYLEVSDGTAARLTTMTLPAGSTVTDWETTKPGRGTWNHLAFTFDATTRQFTSTLNGAALVTGTVAGSALGPVTATSAPLVIGGSATTRPMDGLVDDVALTYGPLTAPGTLGTWTAN